MRTFCVLAVTLGFCAAAQANVITCANGTLASYVSSYAGSGGCTINNLMFAGWTGSTTGQPMVIAPNLASLNVTPIATPGDEGFMFSGGLGVNTPDLSQDIVFGYTIMALNGAMIHGLTLGLNGSASGTGRASDNELYCRGGIVAGCLHLQQLTVSAPPGTYSAWASFPGITTLGVLDDWSVVAGSRGGAMSSAVIKQYHSGVVPEPGTLTLLLTGFAVVGICTLRRRIRT